MFNSARLKLTAWYLLIIGTISVSFSGVIYRMLSVEIERFAIVQQLRIERQYPGMVIVPDFNRTSPIPTIDYELVNETKHRLAIFLMTVNGVILLFAGGLGYILAGKTLEPIKLMVEEQNQFISDASHELRTPLTSLKSAMEVSLRDKKLNLTEARVLLTESIQEVDKLQSLSDGLLSLTQFQNSDGQVKFEKVALEEVANKAVAKLAPQAKLKRIKLVQNNSNVIVNGNLYALTDMLVILLDNAIKYSKPGGKVEVNSKKTDGWGEISVKDEGTGIESRDIPHIFDRFYRSDSARSRQDAGGYGLGLAIAKKIVNAHHGSISVSSKTGVGSVFTVKLPYRIRFS